MKTLNKNQWIAIFVALVVLGYLLFSGHAVSLFNSSSNNAGSETNLLPETGVRVENLTLGTGEEALAGDVLTVHYVGRLPDGRVFDSSLERATPFSFTLGAGQVIRGWEEGLSGMRVGGKRQLVIAPDYAYGEQGAGTIPPNSVLIFEVELLDVERP